MSIGANWLAVMEAAAVYRRGGLCVLPAATIDKRPAVGAWSSLRDNPPDMGATLGLFQDSQADGICVVTGAASGHIEALDFDLAGELFPVWRDTVDSINADILPGCMIEKTPSGGYHVFYRRADAVGGNKKLATRYIPVPVGGDHEYAGKKYTARQNATGFHLAMTAIETRGDGGIILVAPSPGYAIVSGKLENLRTLTADEHRILFSVAKALNETPPDARHGVTVAPESTQTGAGHENAVRANTPASGPLKPGDDFNQRGDARPHLLATGWQLVRAGENEHWRRPGKNDGVSATLKAGVFWVFSSNAEPFKPDTGYGPFAVFAILAHGGNWGRAAGALRLAGYGGDVHADPALDAVDISALESSPPKQAEPATENSVKIVVENSPDEKPEPENDDPGIMPDDLMDVPGLINLMQEYCLENAPQPNRIQSFAGALAFQAFLAGRKVRDAMNCRTNLYLLGLAHSASGKDFPRQLNFNLADAAGYNAGEVSGRFVSGEGIEDAVHGTPNMLFQIDEIDGMLAAIGKKRQDGRPDTMMGALLSMYTSSGGVYPMRRKAHSENSCNGQTISQPNLTVYGTAIPNHYLEAVSERMLTNGFFSRCMIFESGPRHPGRDIDRVNQIPERLVSIAKWWRNFNPGGGNLSDMNPRPRTVEYTPAGKEIMAHTRRLASEQCTIAEEKNDAVGTAVWGRVHEHARKLALVYSVSENFETPAIGERAAEWGSRVAIWQQNRSVFMSQKHVADSEFEGHALNFMRKLDAAGGRCSHGEMLKKMRMSAKDFAEIVNTLETRNDITKTVSTTATKPVTFYTKI